MAFLVSRRTLRVYKEFYQAHFTGMAGRDLAVNRPARPGEKLGYGAGLGIGAGPARKAGRSAQL